MERILAMFGIAKKAGRLYTGSNAVLRSVLYKDSFLVIVTTDAGKSVKEKFNRICEENNVPFFIIGDELDFEKATGEKNKVIYSVTDSGIANKIKSLIVESGLSGGAVIG